MSRHVFLSHAGIDTEPARQLKRRILDGAKASGEDVTVWFDKDDLMAGMWQAQIEAAIERSTVFLVYVGSRGVVNWVDAEVRLGLDRAIRDSTYPFVPVIAASAPGPEALPGFARQFQGVLDVERQTDQFAKLMVAVFGDAQVGNRPLETEPFFGLRAIDESRSYLFFGREQETEALLKRLHRQTLMLVTGDSGSGKSSLVRAGLVPRFRGGGLALLDGDRPEDKVWHVVVTRPRTQPLRALGDAVDEAARKLGLQTADRETLVKLALSGDPEEVRRALLCGLPAEETRLLLVVDQFEELLTISPPERRLPFIDLLLNLADPRDGRLHVLLTMRLDYVNLCSDYDALRQRLESEDRAARFLVGRMSDDGLRRIVTEPLRLAGVPDADRDALAQTVLAEVGTRPGDLALVQLALTETWRVRQQYEGDLLRAYAAVGRVEGALAKAAQAVAGGLTKGEAALLDAVLVRLVRLGDTGGATRRVAARDEFDEARWALIQKLAAEEGRRLVLLGGSDDRLTAEIAHEALVTGWPRFQSFLQNAAAGKRVLDDLIPKAKDWAASTDPKALADRLATGADLDRFSKLAEADRGWLSVAERKFIAASEKAAERRRSRDRTLIGALTIAAVVLGLLLVAAVGAGIYAGRQAQIATEQRAIAEQRGKDADARLRTAQINQSRFLSSRSHEATNGGDAATGMLLALAALPARIGNLADRPYVAEAEAALYQAALDIRELAVLAGHEGPVYSVAFSPDGTRVVTASSDKTARLWDAQRGKHLAVLAGHEDTVISAAFSLDGTRVVTASSDKTARLWDAQSGKLLAVLAGHENAVISATFSSDGTRVVTASSDKTARLWDAQSGKQLAALAGHEDAVTSAAFSPDGTRVVTASDDKTARLWDARSGKLLAVLAGHEDAVTSAAFSPDGTRVVTASRDSTARLWDAQSGKLLAVLARHEYEVRSVAFSPDGTRVVTASSDKTARLWDAQSGKQLAILAGHQDSVTSAAFSPDGTRVVTASGDKTARLWDAQSGKPLAVLAGHEAVVTSAAFSPDGTRVVTASSDKTARLWDAQSGNLLAVLAGHEGWVNSAAFSPDGTRAVTASDDRTARLWDAQSGKPLAVLAGHEGAVNSAAFSPDGTRVVTASSDKTARLWDAQSGELLAVLAGHEGPVYSAAFSPDGTRVVTTSRDKTARLWDAQSGKPLAVLAGHKGQVTSAAFSPDGTRVVTASWDRTARLWDAQSGKPLAVLAGHEGEVNSAAFSPDGTRVVTASSDKTARLWDARSGKLLAVLAGHEGWVFSAAFSPDGTRVVTASDDKTARLWDAQSGKLLAVLAGHEDAVNSAAFSPDGTRVVTASDDKTARLWRVFSTTQALIDYARATVPRQLTQQQRHQYFLDESPAQ